MLPLMIFVSTGFYFMISRSFHGPQIIRTDSYDGGRGCLMPVIERLNPVYNWLSGFETSRWFTSIKCSSDKDWLIWSPNGSLTFHPDILNKYEGDIKCIIYYLSRIDDYHNVIDLENHEQFDSIRSKYLKPRHDFLEAKCSAPKTGESKNHLMAGVAPKPDVLKRSESYRQKNDNQDSLNIMFFGFDSISRVNFIHNLPKTYKYLTEELDATILNRHNIVGDGTTINLVATFTGEYLYDLPDTRRAITNRTVDEYPFVWKKLREKNYVTGYMEDGPDWGGTFHYRLNGFKEWPLDHESRSFQVELDKQFNEKKLMKYCLGSETKLDVMQNWLKEFYHSYPKHVLKFLFGFHSEYSHDFHSFISTADEPSVKWLKSLEDEGILNKTILFFMSDHGHRFDYVRKTLQGKLEERLPFYSVVVPKWFKSRYPNAYKSLKINGKTRFTTHFDIHATIKAIAANFNERNEDTQARHTTMTRSMSLFSEIPIGRSCSDAGLTPHWCACSEWLKVDINSDISIRVVESIVQFFNNMAKSAGRENDCCKLQTKEIQSVHKLATQGENNVQVYQAQFLTSPGDALFEVTTKHLLDKDTFETNFNDVSRINPYGTSSSCIDQTAPHLSKFCNCEQKSFLNIFGSK